MRTVIHALLPEVRLPDEAAEVAATYRTVLHGKRLLLLFDNASGQAQVDGLQPPEGCLLLVTSRTQFHLPGLRAVDLDRLPRPDSIQLLHEICPRLGDSADDYAAVCGDLPLALRVAASALVDRPLPAPQRHLEHLRAEPLRHLSEVERAVAASYDLLPPDLRQAWCLLAAFPAEFDPPAAAAVWDLDGEQAEAWLSELVCRNLVVWNEETARLRLHDLLREFARGRAEGEALATARWRHAEHYRGVLAAANEEYLAGGDGVVAGLGIFDRERANIEAGFELARTAMEDRGRAELAMRYPDAGAFLLALRLTPRERTRWLESQRAAAQAVGDRRGEGNALGNLGVAYKHLGETRRAIELYEQQLVITREIGERRGEGAALGNLGLAYAALGETRRAIELYEQQLVITREIGDRRGEGTALGNLGNAYQNLGETRRAIELYEQRLVIAREIGDRRGESIGSWNLGLRYEAEGDLARAAELMQVCVDFERELGHPDAEAHAAQVEAIRQRLAEGG